MSLKSTLIMCDLANKSNRQVERHANVRQSNCSNDMLSSARLCIGEQSPIERNDVVVVARSMLSARTEDSSSSCVEL